MSRGWLRTRVTGRTFHRKVLGTHPLPDPPGKPSAASGPSPTDALGSLFWSGLAGLILTRVVWGEWWRLPQAGTTLLVALRLLWRAPEQTRAPFRWRLLAWVGAAWPLLLEAPARPVGTVGLGLLGTLLTLWALGTLGRAFGIAPAHRGMIVTGGPYRWVRHPMYAGELLAFLGVVGDAPTLRNLVVGAGVVGLTLARIWGEERLLQADPAYRAYQATVRWRLLPGVW